MFFFHLLLRQKVEPKGDHDPSPGGSATAPRPRARNPSLYAPARRPPVPRGSWTPTAHPTNTCCRCRCGDPFVESSVGFATEPFHQEKVEEDLLGSYRILDQGSRGIETAIIVDAQGPQGRETLRRLENSPKRFRRTNCNKRWRRSAVGVHGQRGRVRLGEPVLRACASRIAALAVVDLWREANPSFRRKASEMDLAARQGAGDEHSTGYVRSPATQHGRQRHTRSPE